MTKNLADKVKKGVIWTSFFFGLRFTIRFGAHVVIARLLLPEDFGLMGVAVILVQFSRRVSDLGFNQALIQLKKVKPEHYDTVFVINTGFALIVTIILLLISRSLAIFFSDMRLAPIFMVISFDFILRSLGNVPRTILIRKMRFKELGFADAMSNSVQLISPILLALMEFGVWSLVWGNILGSVTFVIILYFLSKWYPKLRFRTWALKEVFSFGLWTTVNKNLTFFVNNCDKLIIAKVLNVEQLGYYERALNLLSIPRIQITNNLNRILFPAYSKIQDDDKRTVNGLLKVIKYLTFVFYPVMIGVYFVAPSFVTVLYGPNWRPTIIPLQILCFSTAIYTLARIFFPILMARGWVQQAVFIQAKFLTILVIGLIIGLKWGINGAALSISICAAILLILVTLFIQGKLPFTLKSFFLAQKTAMMYGLVQIVCLSLLVTTVDSFFSVESWQMLMLISLISLLSVFAAHFVFRYEDADDIIKTLTERVRKVRLPKKNKKI